MKMEIACSLGSRLRGLIGRDAFDGVLLLVPCNDIHTFGMRRPIDVAFVDAAGSVLEARRNVVPNRRIRNKGASATLERYASTAQWLEPGDSMQHLMQVHAGEGE